jgi:hypothetical protein
MVQRTNWSSKAETSRIALPKVAPKVDGQTQIVRTIRKALFPREFCKGAGVLELNGAQRVRELNRCADIPHGATARGAGDAKASNLSL